MKSMTSLIEPIDGALLADGFEDALIGFGYQFSYAIEYFEFNVSGAWVGVNTPVFLQGDY